MAKGVYHDLNPVLQNVQRQEMAHSHQHNRWCIHIAQNQDRDLEVPLTLHPEVLMQHPEIIHVLDQDQIL